MILALGALVAIAACTKGTAPPDAAPAPDLGPTVDPLITPGASFHVQGTVKGPKGMISTQEKLYKLASFSEDPLPGMRVVAADSRFQAVKEVPGTWSDAQGHFAIDTPSKAGFILAFAASGSAPLAVFYRGDSTVAMDVASTMVAWKLSADASTHSVSLDTVDPAKAVAVTALVAQELTSNNLSPDYSVASWPGAMVFYAYRTQGKIAAAFNAMIPGSVPPKSP
jgi:hypothetical protein